jgi:hypothetical protein
MADIKLVFPELSGVERGAKFLAQDFKSKPLYYLARESIQNSLDAWTKDDRDAGRPARIVFRLHEVPKGKVICRLEILDAFERAEKYWESRQSMFQPIWDAARASLTSDKIGILEISDYNTCGLEGDDRKVGERWHSLVKSEGVPNPNAVAGGSYGIGKMAPFACSDARTVLYSTKTKDGHAFQGVCRLATFEQDRVRRAPDGFIGLDTGPRSEPYIAVRKENDIPVLFRRTEIGTSVWCLGFTKHRHWSREVILSSLDSFWLAIHLGNLEVEVIDEQGLQTLINKQSLVKVIADMGDKAHLAKCSLAAYETKNEKHRLVSPEGAPFHVQLGHVKLYLAFGNKDTCSNECYQVRNNFMRIRSKGWRCPVDYTAVVVCDDPQGAAYLRSMEPPSHEDWVPELLQMHEQARANKVLKELEQWLRSSINSAAAADAGDEIIEELTFDGENEEGNQGKNLKVQDAPVDPFGAIAPVKSGGDTDYIGIKNEKRIGDRKKKKEPKKPMPRTDGTVDGGYFYARVVSATSTKAKIHLTRIAAFEGKIPVALAFTALGSEGETETQHPTSCLIVGAGTLTKEVSNSAFFSVERSQIDQDNITIEIDLANARDMRLGIRFKFKS